MEGEGACDGLSVIDPGGKIYERELLCRMFEGHHLNQPLANKRREIDGLPLLATAIGVWKPGVEDLLFEYVLGHGKAVRQ